MQLIPFVMGEGPFIVINIDRDVITSERHLRPEDTGHLDHFPNLIFMLYSKFGHKQMELDYILSAIIDVGDRTFNVIAFFVSSISKVARSDCCQSKAVIIYECNIIVPIAFVFIRDYRF